MTLTRLYCILSLIFLSASLSAQTSKKLSGTVIGTTLCIDYTTGQSTTKVNTAANAFDGNLATFFATNARSNTWCGLDLGTPHVITRVGWSPRNDGLGPGRVKLAVFEGANRADFSDGVPIYVTREDGTIGTMSYADLKAQQAFRYVRYVGPNDARCNVAEVEFYGYAAPAVTFDPEEGEAVKIDPDLYYRPTNLPVVVVHTKNAQEPYDKTHEIEAIISVISADKILTDTATIRLRGNASMDFPKKPYRIKWDDKHKVLGSPAKAKKWTLINNYGDKTLMRNMLAFDISRRFDMAYTPFCTPVDVIVNGEYKGCYQLCDQVEVKKNRVDIDEMDATCTTGDALTGGYLIEIDAYADAEPQHFYSKRGTPVTIKSPDEDIIVSAQKSYITNHYKDLETRVFASNFTSETSGYRARLDLESFLRHFLIGELSGNTDTYWSVYLYKPRGDERLYCGPVWDFDIAFENDYRTNPINNKSDWVYRSGGSSANGMREFVDRIILSDSQAAARLRDIWAQARHSGAITEEALIGYIDESASLLDESQGLNFKRWPILGQQVHMNFTARGSYAAEVEALRKYLRDRLKWMDKKLKFDASTLGVVEVETDSTPDDDTVYTLSGQRARLPLAPGVYVQRGRKLIVR